VRPTARYSVREALDVYEPRRAIQALGRELGFERKDCHELAIVLSELVSNIVKYGVSGSVSMEKVVDARHGPGVAIVAEDVGPPFFDLAMAVQDGYDDRGPIDPVKLLRRGGLGTGLGAVVRLTDSFHVEPLPKGKRVRVTRFVKRPKPSHGRQAKT
jgi:serine/threonine-protein kinase RsbT